MPPRFDTFDEVERYLDSIPMFSRTGATAANFSLESMELFSERAGRPSANLTAIHVAGTNGKGTTCQMLSGVYRQAGYRTGLYTSPHLLRFNDRIQVNGKSIPDEQILLFFRTYGELLDEVPLTYFEISTSLAFWYLEKEKCDIVIVEAGLGGRLDATNILEPRVCAITSVSLDHTDVLGNTVAEIALEKAGIIKPGRPVVAGCLTNEALAEVKRVAGRCRSDLSDASNCRPRWRGGNILLTDPVSGEEISVNGAGRKRIDMWNSAVAWLVVQILQNSFPVAQSQFAQGIERLDEYFPDHAHFQRIHPRRDWYFDGAHNAEAARSLFGQIRHLSDGREPVFILSVMTDKAVPEFLENFQPYRYVYYIDTGIERSAQCDQILPMIPQVKCLESDESEVGAILEGLKSELVIFAGSFYFYQQVKRWTANQLPSDHKNNSRA